MLKNMQIIVYLLLTTLTSCWLSTTTTHAQTTPAPTLSDTALGFILSAMGNPSNYTLSNDPTQWNISDIISRINATDPDWLYDGLSNGLLTSVLPDYIIQQLPLDVLIYRCLCNYIISPYHSLNASETCIDICNTDNKTTTAYTPYFCNIEPLVPSTYSNPISDSNAYDDDDIDLSGCGLKCNAGPLVYGLKDNEQSLVDAFKVIGTTVCFIAILFLFVNQILDQKFSNEKFWDKPLLHHCPYFISASVFCIMILMTVGEVIGKKTIVCNLDDDSFSCQFHCLISLLVY